MVTENIINLLPETSKKEKFTTTPEWLRDKPVNPNASHADIQYTIGRWHSVDQSLEDIGNALKHWPPESASKQIKA